MLKKRSRIKYVREVTLEMSFRKPPLVEVGVGDEFINKLKFSTDGMSK